MIIGNDVTLIFGDKPIFNKISFRFNHDQKIGVVGRNGAGKSTLLKAISGTQALDEGSIELEKKRKIGYLPQEVVLLSEKSVLEEAFSVFEDVVSMQKEVALLEKKIDASKEIHQVLERYAELQEELGEVNIDALKVEARSILTGLGFSPVQLNQKVSELSVGWRMRLVLAKLLLQKPDFFLFDEPTNHLDVVAKDWFLKFLQDVEAGFLIVSHDRYFLEHVVDYVYELDRGKGTMYRGNYATYEKQKEKDDEMLQSAYDQQQRDIKAKLELAQRFRAKASKAKMAQGLFREVEKMERIEPPIKQRNFSIRFAPLERSGKVTLTVKDLSKTFGDKTIFSDASFELLRGEKAAIVAANGVGKTTLLNIVNGKYPLENGSIEFGHNVQWAMFEQDQDKLLDHKKTILEEVENACTTSEARAKVRAMLGTFLFPGDDVNKRIGVLSGGEKNRVAMVKVFLQQSNFLILDEPTNHLDLQSKDILLKALQQYEGTILFVSHDRDFLDDLATKIFELTPTGIRSYEGTYSNYLHYKEHVGLGDGQVAAKKAVKAEPKKKEAPKLSGKELFALQKAVNRIERSIKKYEAEKESIEAKIAQSDYDAEEFIVISKRLKEVGKLLKDLYKEWEQVQAKLA